MRGEERRGGERRERGGRESGSEREGEAVLHHVDERMDGLTYGEMDG